MDQHEYAALSFRQQGECVLEPLAQLAALDQHVCAWLLIWYLEAIFKRSHREVSPFLLVQQPPMGDGEDPGGEGGRAVGLKTRQDFEQLTQQFLRQVVWLSPRSRSRNHRVERACVAAQECVLGSSFSPLSPADDEGIELHGVE